MCLLISRLPVEESGVESAAIGKCALAWENGRSPEAGMDSSSGPARPAAEARAIKRPRPSTCGVTPGAFTRAGTREQPEMTFRGHT